MRYSSFWLIFTTTKRLIDTHHDGRGVAEVPLSPAGNVAPAHRHPRVSSEHVTQVRPRPNRRVGLARPKVACVEQSELSFVHCKMGVVLNRALRWERERELVVLWVWADILVLYMMMRGVIVFDLYFLSLSLILSLSFSLLLFFSPFLGL